MLVMIIVAMLLCLLLQGSVLSLSVLIYIEAFLLILLIFVLAFFRDPDRVSPKVDTILLAPADGRITDIEVVNEESFINGSALKIGIFLSVFNTHINRAPCNVTVEQIEYKKGKYKDARNPLSSKVNESNDLKFTRADRPNDRLIVRQISGAMARRIVCKTSPGQSLKIGERFGMIKFGSRTELYLPYREDVQCVVNVGDKVKAGLSVIVRYE